MAFVLPSFLSGLLNLLPYVLIASLVVGSYFYGHYEGTSSCNAAQLQTIVNQKQARIDDLLKQEADMQTTIANLKQALHDDSVKITDAKNQIDRLILLGPGCDQSSALLDVFNKVRK